MKCCRCHQQGNNGTVSGGKTMWTCPSTPRLCNPKEEDGQQMLKFELEKGRFMTQSGLYSFIHPTAMLTVAWQRTCHWWRFPLQTVLSEVPPSGWMVQLCRFSSMRLLRSSRVSVLRWYVYCYTSVEKRRLWRLLSGAGMLSSWRK